MSDYKIIFEGGLNDREKFEMEARGYRSHVTFQWQNKEYSVVFYDPIRLGQDIEDEHVIAEHGLIIVKSVTEETICKAIDQLIRDNYFIGLKPR